MAAESYTIEVTDHELQVWLHELALEVGCDGRFRLYERLDEDGIRGSILEAKARAFAFLLGEEPTL